MANCGNNTLFMGRPNSSGCTSGFVKTTPVGEGTSMCSTNLGPLSCPKGIGARPNREAVREKLRDYVLLKLGAPVIDVELDMQQVDLAIDESMDIFEDYAPRDYFDYYPFITTPGKSVYQMPPDVGLIRNVFYKEEGSFGFQASDLGGAIPIEYFYPGGSTMQGGMVNPSQPMYGRMSEWMSFKIYSSTFSRLSSNIGGWEWISDHNQIKLYPVPCQSHRVLVHHLQKCKDWKEAIEPLRVGAYYHAMLTLGRIRSKYQNIPGVGAGGIVLDGVALVQEANEGINKWKDDLITRWGDICPITMG